MHALINYLVKATLQLVVRQILLNSFLFFAYSRGTMLRAIVVASLRSFLAQLSHMNKNIKIVQAISLRELARCLNPKLTHFRYYARCLVK